MKKIFIMIGLIFTGCSQPAVITKTSPEISRTAYAIKDAFNNSRIDLADQYSEQLTSLVVPPKDSIIISPIMKDGKRVAIIPNKYTQDDVVVVGTTEWSNLLKIKEVVIQLANDKTTLSAELEKVQQEIREQQELKEKLAIENTQLNIDIEKCKQILIKKNLYLFGLISLIGVYIFLKIKKIALPFALL